MRAGYFGGNVTDVRHRRVWYGRGRLVYILTTQLALAFEEIGGDEDVRVTREEEGVDYCAELEGKEKEEAWWSIEQASTGLG